MEAITNTNIPTEGTAQPTTEQTEQTQSTAAYVDMALIEQTAQTRADRAARSVVKDMLRQAGLDDSSISSMLAEYKAKQATPEQTIQALTKERDEGFKARDAELATLKQEKILRGHGINDDEDIILYSIRIKMHTAPEIPFEQAAKEYFEAHPQPKKVPASAIFGGTGKTPIHFETSKDNDMREAMGIKT